jgi:hypothetical protein
MTTGGVMFTTGWEERRPASAAASIAASWYHVLQKDPSASAGPHRFGHNGINDFLFRPSQASGDDRPSITAACNTDPTNQVCGSGHRVTSVGPAPRSSST